MNTSLPMLVENYIRAQCMLVNSTPLLFIISPLFYLTCFISFSMPYFMMHLLTISYPMTSIFQLPYLAFIHLN